MNGGLGPSSTGSHRCGTKKVAYFCHNSRPISLSVSDDSCSGATIGKRWLLLSGAQSETASAQYSLAAAQLALRHCRDSRRCARGNAFDFL